VIPLARGFASASASREITLGALVERLGGTIPEAQRPREVRTLATAGEGDRFAISPVLRPAYVEAAVATEAVLLVSPELLRRVPAERAWVHPNPAWVMAKLLADSAPGPVDHRDRAFLAASATVPASVTVGPFAVIHDDVIVGEDCRLGAHVVLHPGVRLGDRVRIGDGAVIGREGFGFVPSETGVVRMPHLGGVILEDDVEVGALSTIDQGVLSPTRVGRGTKLDAHVHVGHNGRLGQGTFVAAQAGFAGSVTVGDNVQIGGQAGVADHLTIGDGARLAAKSGVIGDVPPGETVAGYPALARAVWLRTTAVLLGLARGRSRARSRPRSVPPTSR
jgi:UDP-3-O-[3-hydroxymyristoyl] glucosamine N-acyltransferase